MILGAVQRSPGIYLAVDENPGKPQLGDRLLKGMYFLLSMEPWAAAKKKKKNFWLVWWCHQLLSRFPANGLLPECHVSR